MSTEKHKTAKSLLACAGALGIALALFLGGCASGTPAHRIEAGGSEAITSLDKVNLADFDIAAQKLLNSMLRSGVFNEFPKKPVLMRVGRIKNNTSEVINMSMFTSRITTFLNRSKLVRVLADDAYSRELAEFNGVDNLPQIILVGEIAEDTTTAGRTKERSYTFILRLNIDGAAAWEEMTTVSKQGTRASVGW